MVYGRCFHSDLFKTLLAGQNRLCIQSMNNNYDPKENGEDVQGSEDSTTETATEETVGKEQPEASDSQE